MGVMEDSIIDYGYNIVVVGREEALEERSIHYDYKT
jgi:hypothetical protein